MPRNVSITIGELDLSTAIGLLNHYAGLCREQSAALTKEVTPAAEAVPDLSPKTMRDELAMFSERHGRDAVKEVFSKLGIHKFGELPVDRYPELRALLDVAENAA